MDIHAPEGPTHSFKDFFIHIIIVTIGILIALGLEGVRETIHEHHVVRDARENFRAELEEDQAHIGRELENTRGLQVDIKKIVADLPELRQHPDQLAVRVAKIEPTMYFFSSSRWESALSTGALGHMNVDEVNRYAEADFLVHSYASIEAEASPVWMSLESYFAARPTLSQQGLDPGIEKLLLFQSYIRTMINVGEQLQAATDEALKASKP
jgi:hypothetical protein